MYPNPKAKYRATRASLRKGIEAYAAMQALIGEAILERGGRLSERDFDTRFGWPRHQEYLPCAMTGDTFILTPYGGSQQQYLQLAQFMLAADLIDAETGDDGLVYYKMRD